MNKKTMNCIQTICGLLCAGIVIILTGCSEDTHFVIEESPVIELVKENEIVCEDCVSLRNLPLVVIQCVDAYTSVGGSPELYKGTHCWIIGVGVPSIGGGSTTSPSYHPDGYPTSQGGGSGFNSPQTSWFFGYNPLQTSPIFSPFSTLNLLEKQMLADIFVLLCQSCTQEDYISVYNYLMQKNIKILFKMDASISAQAAYNQATKEILFKYINAITLTNLAEELIHAVQDYGFYGNTMLNAKRNVEFEAKVFRDLAERFHNADAPISCDLSAYNWAGLEGQSNNFESQYIPFINSILQNRVFSMSDVIAFQNLCNQYVCLDSNGKPVTYQSNFTPQVLRHFFGKIRPPKQ